MKKLKFMLAAATAIGLASATQADQYNTTGFEKLAVGTAVTTGVEDNRSGYSYFYYAGQVAEDNESVIAAGTPDIARPRGAAAVDDSRTNILQVSTGTDPLMRTYAPVAGGQPQATSIATDTYVDTLVQFTVTPYTDTVTPGANDKLMVYLGENTNDVGEVTSKSLKVIAGYINSSAQVSAKEYEVANVSVDTNTWYRLTVKTIPDISVDDQGQSGNEGSFMGFQIFIDGTLCTLNEKPYDDDENSGAWDLVEDSIYFRGIDNKQMVPSILATSNDENKSSKLQGVGFAGEGKVDDIVFSTTDPFATVYDFTFAFDTAAGVSAVTYTVGGVTYDQARTFSEVEAGTAVAITSITYADDAMADAITAVNLREDGNNTFAVTNAGARLTVTAKDAYASVGDQKYDSFSDAFAAAASAGGTVKLVRNLSDSTPMGTTVAADQSAVLDLNGKTITTLQGSSYWMTIAGTLVVTDSTEQASGKIESRPTNQTIFKVDGTFTMAAGTLDMTTVNPANTASGFNVKAGGTAYMNGGTVLGRIASGVTNATVVVNGGTVDIVQSKNRGDVTIYGGTVGAIEKSGTSENGNIVIPALVNNELNPTQFGTNMVGEVSYDEFLSPATGYTVAKGEGAEWFMVAVATFNIAYLNGDGTPFTSWAQGYTAPATYTASDAVTLPTSENVNLLVTGVSFGGWTNAEGTVVASWAAGAMSGDQTFYAKLDPVVPQPTGEELEPGEQSSTTYATQAEAEAALDNVTIAASDAVTNALDAAAQATYLAKFEKKVVAVDGGYKVEVGLTAAATTALQAEVNADAAEVIEDLSEANVELTTTPGFYYSFMYGTTLDNMAEVGTRALATGSTLTLARPTTANATAGFYKVIVNIVPAAQQ